MFPPAPPIIDTPRLKCENWDMPYKIVKRTGKKPWKIINKDTGLIVGSSTSKKKAEASAHARLAASHGWKPTWKR